MERETRGRPAAPPEPAGAASAEPTYEVDVDNSPIAKAATVIASLFSHCYLLLEKSI